MASFGLKLPPIESAKDSAEGAVSADGAKRAAVPASLGRLVEVGQVLVPGIYAWAVTVVPAAYDSSHPVLAWIAACSACVFLCVGAFVVRARSSLGHALGIWAFLIACTATWLLSTSSLQIDRLDPWRAGAGSIGWILFALGWGTPWRVRQHPDDDPRALLEPKLEARERPGFGAALPVIVGTAGAILCMLLAWQVSEQNRAILLHAAALACGVATVNAAASIAMAQGTRKPSCQPSQRLSFAYPWLMALCVLVILGIAWAVGN